MAQLERLDLNLDNILAVERSDGLANLQTERLRWLSIRCFQRACCLDILELVSRCANVEDLSLTLDFPQQPFHGSFALHKLKNVRIGCLPYALLCIISMPALEVLHFDGDRMSPAEAISPIASVTFPCLRSLIFEHYVFVDNDVPPLSGILGVSPMIETIHAIECERHCIIMFAMLDTVEKHMIARPFSEPTAVDVYDEIRDVHLWIAPDLKTLHLSRQEECTGRPVVNLSVLFSEVLSQWQSAHIEVDDWSSYGG